MNSDKQAKMPAKLEIMEWQERSWQNTEDLKENVMECVS